MKKSYLAIAAFVIAFSTAGTSFADDTAVIGGEDGPTAIYVTDDSAESEPTVYSLSLDDAIKMAYDGNEKLRANELEQYGNEINIKSAEITYLRMKKASVRLPDGFETMYCAKNGYGLEAARMQLRLSQKKNEQIKGTIAYDTTQAYYNCGLMNKLVNAAQNSYELAVANQNVVDAQYALGLIPKLDYENASIAVERAANALNSYELQRDLAYENLKILLNKDTENCSIVITDEIECSDYESDVVSDAASAVETRYDLTALKESRDLAKMYFDLSDVLTEASAVYNQANAAYVQADYDYTNTCKLITLSIKSCYNNILTAKADMNTAELTYNMKVKEYDSAKVKYELGMITNLELTKTINDLYDAQVTYANAKLSYRMAVEKYKYEVTIGL